MVFGKVFREVFEKGILGVLGRVVAEVFWRGVFSEVLLISLVRFLKRVLVRF
jgi:hypothetical protein